MQGQRDGVGSLTETFEFDHESTSGDAIVDQQICWNHSRNPDGNGVADFARMPMHVNNAHVNFSNQEHRNLGGWSLGEPSSSGTKNELTDIFSLDAVNMNTHRIQNSSSNSVPLNFNLNVTESSDDCQIIEPPNMYKSTIMGNERIPATSGSNTSVTGGYMVDGSDGRPSCSLDGRRQSHKRKAVEENLGQSSMAGSSSHYQLSESSIRSAHSGAGSSADCSNPGSSLHISAPLGGAGPRLGLDTTDMNVAGHGESSQRNTRLRVNPSNQESFLPPLFSLPNVVRQSSTLHSHHSSRHFPVDHLLDFRSSPVVNGINNQCQPALISVPAFPQNVQSIRLNGCSRSRAANTSSSVTLGQREEDNTRSMDRNVWEHPMFLPATDVRISARNPPVTNVPNGNTSAPENIASTSRTGSSLGTNTYLPPTWGPHPVPTFRNSRRLAEYVRHSLVSVNGVEAIGQSSNSRLPSGRFASSEETRLPVAGNPGHQHRRPSRSALLMERRGDGVLGIPYPLRTFRAAGGRSRLVSEIHSVLDRMRRGEGLRLEDVMILDQSVLFGFADIHDRHGDMRLDVDNMSYEELLALEERIGNVSTGLSEETIKSKLKQRKFSVAVGTEVEKEPCCICQEEYNEGEGIGALDCGHDFHTGCIKQWLMHKNLCPICKTTGLAK